MSYDNGCRTAWRLKPAGRRPTTPIELLACPGVVRRTTCPGKARLGGRSRKRSSKFTLIELLVVVAIIGILAALLLPGLQRANETAKRIVCASNERQIYLAWTNYVNDFDGRLPAVGTAVWDGVYSGQRPWAATMVEQLHPAVHYAGQYEFRNGTILLCPKMKYYSTARNVQYITYGMLSYGIGGWAPSGTTAYRTSVQIKYPSLQVAFVDNNLESSGAPHLGYYAYSNNLNYITHFRHDGLVNIVYCDGHVEPHDVGVLALAAGWTAQAPWGNP